MPLHQYNRFATQQLMLNGLLQHATGRQLRQPVIHGKWSVHEQLAHYGLVDITAITFTRAS
ncbi:MAG: hypothetical protein IM638_19015 [Bacteroidetes bacterium]|nr:hypothetical protein [Bacteroidota bacterium]